MTETTTSVTPATAAPISDLRRRMLQDMTNRNFGDKTQRDYIRHIETFAKFLGRAPDMATGDDVRRFQSAQIADGAQPPKMNTQASRYASSLPSRLAASTSRTNWRAPIIRASCRAFSHPTR